MTTQAGLLLFLPVEPHVYKFLHAKCGEKLVASKQDFFGSVVLDLLLKSYSNIQKVKSEFTYPIEISLRYMEDYGVFLDDQIVRKFNNRMDKMFREELRTFVSITHEFNGVPKDAALRQFMEHYNITEEDMKFETLKKYLVRTI